MLVYECLMLMLMLCKSSYARLTPRVLQPLPLIKISSQDLHDLPFLDKRLPKSQAGEEQEGRPQRLSALREDGPLDKGLPKSQAGEED